METKMSLHELMAAARKSFTNWQQENPYKHPAELHRLMADEIVRLLPPLTKTVTLHPTVYAGGVPEYAKAVAMLREAGIRVTVENF